MGSNQWREVTKAEPCPICSHGDWCAFSTDGSACRCMRLDAPSAGWKFLRTDSDGGSTFRRTDATPTPAPAKPDKPRKRHETFEGAVKALAWNVERCQKEAGKRIGAEFVAYYPYERLDESDNAVEVNREVRFLDPSGKKEMRWCHQGSDNRWVTKRGDHRGIFGLGNVLAAPSDTPILIVEGAKVAVLAKDLDLLAVTSGGCTSAKLVDWSPLSGRDVVVLPDAGEDGAKYADAIQRALAKLNSPPSVKVIRLPGLEDSEDLEEYIANQRTAGLSDDAIREKIVTMIEDAPKAEPPAPEPEPKKKRAGPPIDEQLLKMVLDRYDIRRSMDDKTFATLKDGKSCIVQMVNTDRRGICGVMRRMYTDRHEYANLDQSVLNKVVATLDSRGDDLDRETIHLRVADYGENTSYYDPGWRSGQAIQIGPDGWDVVERPPVWFRRAQLTYPMPEPVRGGDLDRLRELINVQTDAEWTMLLGWLVACTFEVIDHPICFLGGRAASGKSTVMHLITSAIDYLGDEDLAPPEDPRSWAALADNSWVMQADNISHIDAAWSNTLCSGVTGARKPDRELYTNTGLVVIGMRRCIILTSIDVGKVRSDLASRLMKINLKRIDKPRKPRVLREAFKSAHGEIFGGLLDLSAKVRGRLPNITDTGSFRCVDYAYILKAIDQELGTTGFDAYAAMQADCTRAVVEDDVVGEMVVKLVRENGGRWSGKMRDLFQMLDGRAGTPKTPATLGKAINHMENSLEAMGIRFKSRPTNDARVWTFYEFASDVASGDDPNVRKFAPAPSTDEDPFPLNPPPPSPMEAEEVYVDEHGEECGTI